MNFYHGVIEYQRRSSKGQYVLAPGILNLHTTLNIVVIQPVSHNSKGKHNHCPLLHVGTLLLMFLPTLTSSICPKNGADEIKAGHTDPMEKLVPTMVGFSNNTNTK